jgi:lipoate-protein ligase A
LEKWRLIQVEYEDPYRNLALEEALLKLTTRSRSSCTIRLWSNPNSVVIGRYQCPNLEVNLNACERYGTLIVRRLTGGGAVYHDRGNLNFSILIPTTHHLSKRGVIDMFHKVGKAVTTELKKRGLNTNFQPPNKILLNDKKISGMAGAVKYRAMLIHGTLLVEANTKILKEVLKFTNLEKHTKFVRSVISEVSNIRKEYNTIDIQNIRDVLRTGFENYFKIKLSEGTLTTEEESLTQKLYKEKYCVSKWNYDGDLSK